MSNDIVQRQQGDTIPVEMGERGLKIQSYAEAFQIAKAAASSRALERWKNPDDAFICIIAGLEIGLSPFQALQDLYPVRGKVAIMGDAAKALVMASDACEYINGGRSDDPPGWWIESKRPGAPAVRTVFTVDDAKRAGLWGKSGPWKDYPQRMLYYRALGFHLRDQFPDVLRGMRYTLEEVNDYPDGKPDQGAATVEIDDPLIEAVSTPIDRPEPPEPVEEPSEPLGLPESDPEPENASEGSQDSEAAESDPAPSQDPPPASEFWRTRFKDVTEGMSIKDKRSIVKEFGFDSLGDLASATDDDLRAICASIQGQKPSGKVEITEDDINEAMGG